MTLSSAVWQHELEPTDQGWRRFLVRSNDGRRFVLSFRRSSAGFTLEGEVRRIPAPSIEVLVAPALESGELDENAPPLPPDELAFLQSMARTWARHASPLARERSPPSSS